MTDPGRPPARSLRGALARGPLVLDSGMGTRLVALGLDLASDDPSLWNLDRPEAVASVHARDADAGSDAVLTNTFGANRRWLDRFGRAADVPEINRRAVAIARASAGPAWVVGSVGPTASADPDALREQADALLNSGVDALLFETQRLDQALAALGSLGASLPASVPVWVSLVSWPAPLADAVRRLEDLGVSALGVNCVPGTRPAVEAARRLSAVTFLPLLAKPNAGLPGDELESPEAFARAVPDWLACGVRLLGGCCGTTERHVAALRAACYDASNGTDTGPTHERGGDRWGPGPGPNGK